MWTRKREKSATLLAIAGLFVAYASQPAAARDRWYVGGDVGVVGLEDITLDIGPTPLSTPASFQPWCDYGYGLGAVIGYDISSFGLRLEAEISYRSSGVRSLRDIGVFLPSIDIPLESGRASALSFMINGLYDFGTVQGFTFSGGGGVGVARVEFANFRERGAPEPFINTSTTSIAFQAIAAVRRAITQNVDVGVKYKFFAVPNLTIDTVAGDRISTSFRSHSAMLSLTYNFPPVEYSVTKRAGQRLRLARIGNTDPVVPTIYDHSGRIRGPHALRDLASLLPFNQRDVVLALQVEPELRAVAEIAPEAHRRICADRAATVQDIRDAA